MEKEKVENMINRLYVGMAKAAMGATGDDMPKVSDYPKVAEKSHALLRVVCSEGTAVVCEAAFELKQALQEHDLPDNWVDEFVYLYLDYLCVLWEESMCKETK